MFSGSTITEARFAPLKLVPLQVALAWLWTGISNLLWPGSAELVFHGPSQSWTGVNLIGSGFDYGEEPLYTDAECAGIH